MPIGNLADITLRALQTLQTVDVIFCEDTRHTAKLLAHFRISKPLLSFYEHNETQRINPLIAKVQQGLSIALVADAGTPLISDPGFKLIRSLIAEGIAIEALPGPCAAINALVLSGLPTDSFYFGGFLPPKSAARIRKLFACKEYECTLIFYESTYRIEKFLNDAYQTLGNRPIALAREMTKKFEEILRGSLEDFCQKKITPRSWKGEFVVVIGGKHAKK